MDATGFLRIESGTFLSRTSVRWTFFCNLSQANGNGKKNVLFLPVRLKLKWFVDSIAKCTKSLEFYEKFTVNSADEPNEN